MILTLRMTADHGGLPEQRRLEHGTLTVGRGAENDWVLTDPERTLSKQHCRFDQSGDGFLLTDLSTNGVFLNDEPHPIGRGRSRSLSDGDTVVLGPFHLAASIGAASDLADPFDPASTAEIVAPFTGVQHTPGSPLAPQSADPWLEQIPGGDFGPQRHVRPQGWETPIDPAEFSAHGQRLADHPLEVPSRPFSHGSEHVPATSTVMKLPAAQSVLPTDWNDVDPLAGADLAPVPFDAPLARTTANPNDIVIPNEELLAALDQEVAETSPRQASPIPIPTVSVTPVLVGSRPAAQSQDVQTIEMPEPTRADPAAPQAVAAPAADPESQAAVTRQGILAAFLDGAGLTAEALGGMRPDDAARDLGRLVRAAIEGAREILATRAMVKSELRVDQTIIQATDNNAMKFAPDVQRCLAAMVGQAPPGFLPGSAAMAQGMDDIKRHELALIAALNGVFAALTERLDPETIMAKVRAENSIGALLPYAREARCWAVYLESYQAFQSTDAENTGGSLLAPLAVAYARQLKRVE